MKTTKNKFTAQEKALAKFLNIDKLDARDSIENGDYLVLTDTEADERVEEYIKENIWAFNKSFLNCHSEAINEIDDKSFAKLQDGCESVNKAIWAMIDDKDHFIKDAISADGRGHFLSSYDGEENEEGEFFIYRIN